ncbi:amidase family protein [Halomonas sp. EGI 63088]|uniref:Amidase family protein n=1 Tax=Halomonas flagellata TaxID=2920385 RepID=A0ABS9RXY7_9GAMM|nr:amidase family protein [Halomonas flagellata]MCH4564710.1 amidase family protein [Halomonas flagellata]
MPSLTRTALAMGEAIRQGSLDPVELTRQSLVKAAESDAVFISLTEQRALAEAEACVWRQRAGVLLGPLDGVPLAWKDLFDIAGTATTAGGKVLGEPPAERDADAVRHAAGAGMIGIGKTNLTELAYSGLGLNPHYGTPHHTPGQGEPRAPGGSSSGSAVAVAKGIVPAAIGTDTAGSLRVPAAFNGLVSYRPSQARHTRRGVTPLASSLDTIGVIATTLEDCLAIDDTMRGEAPLKRPYASPEQSVIVIDSACLDDQRFSSAVRNNLEASAERLSEAGFHVVRRRVASVADTLDAIARHGWLGAAEAYTEYRGLLESTDAKAMDSRVRKRLEAARQMTPDSVVTMYRLRQVLKAQLREELAGAILLTPTVAHVAPRLAPLETDPAHFAEVNLATLRLSMVASLLDSPAVALPSGHDDDQQHTSLQLSAPSGEDESLLRVALSASSVLTV